MFRSKEFDMFKVGDRVKPKEASTIFSSGVVDAVYPEGHFFYPLYMKVLLDVTPPPEYTVGPNPTFVMVKWFELE